MVTKIGRVGRLIVMSVGVAMEALSLCLLSLGHMIARIARQVDGVLAAMNEGAADLRQTPKVDEGELMYERQDTDGEPERQDDGNRGEAQNGEYSLGKYYVMAIEVEPSIYWS